MKIRKIAFSLSILCISLLTMVATTFAWVGITSNSVFDEFTINLKTDNDTGNFGLQLSLDGRPGTFVDSIDEIAIKRQLLKNLGYNSNTIDRTNDENINVTFAKVRLAQCTPLKSTYYPDLFSSNEIQYFENVVDNSQTSKFFWFDVYVSMYVQKANISPDVATAPASIFLREGLLSSNDVGSTDLLNAYTYPSTTYSLDGKSFSTEFLNKKFSGKVSVNPASAARLCVQKFEPTEMYLMTQNVSKGYTIYQYDDNMPTYDSTNNVYSFGGILPSKYNMAYQQYNMSHFGAELPAVPDWQVNRGDVTYEDKGDIGRVCDKDTDGLTVGKMMKFRFYFWFEGWDSDCFEVIDDRSVSVNLSFSNKAPYDV